MKADTFAYRVLRVLVVIVAVVVLVPVMTLIAASLVRNDQTGGGLSLSALHRVTASNYAEVVDSVVNGGEDDPLRRLVAYFVNTLVISLGSVVICLMLAVGGALVISRSTFRWRRGLRQMSLWGYVIPPIVLVFPYSHLLSALGLQGSRFGLLLAHIAFCMPLSLWLMVQYFDAIPLQWDRAAEADGLSCAKMLSRVLLPRAVTGIAAVATFVAVLSWNDVILAYILASERTKTLGVGIQEAFPNETLSSNSTAAAATILASIPIVAGVLLTYAFVVRQMRREWGLSL